MSLTLQSDTEAQAAAPSRRSSLHHVPPAPGQTAPEPSTAVVTPGWYVDPMGSSQSRWWDGTAWTAELSSEAPVEPIADAAIAAPGAVPQNTAPSDSRPAVAPETPADPAAVPLSRRQLRELVGPLTTGPVPIETAVDGTVPPVTIASSALGPVAPLAPFAPFAPVMPTAAAPAVAALPATAPELPDGHSPFEALFESSPAERESAESTVFSATSFLHPADVSDSTVARPWIGAAAPLVPASSAFSPGAVQPAPSGPPAAPSPAAPVSAVGPLAGPTSPAPSFPPPSNTAAPFSSPSLSAPPLSAPPLSAPSSPALPSAAPSSPAPTFSSGAVGFTLPPDPFANSAAPTEVIPPPFVPLGPPAPAKGPVLAISARTTTVAVWLFALLPVVHAAAIWLVLGFLDLGGDPVIRYSVLGAPLFLYVVLAFIDGRVLRGRGFPRTASAVLALIPPLYLLVRAIRVGAAGVVPLLVWLLLQTAAFSFVLLQLPSVFALVPLTAPAASTPAVVASGPITDAQRAAELTPTGMAAELTRQTLAKKLTFSSISCPAIPVTLDGTAVTCVGTIDSVKMNLNVVIDSTLPNSAFALVSEAPAV